MAETLSKQPLPRGPRLTIVTNACGPAVLATDALVANGGQLAILSEESLRSLGSISATALEPQQSNRYSGRLRFRALCSVRRRPLLRRCLGFHEHAMSFLIWSAASSSAGSARPGSWGAPH